MTAEHPAGNADEATLVGALSLASGRYQVLRTLGAGGQGETLEAIDKRDGRLVAIKRFVIRGARSWKDVELAEREATVLSALSHESLPRYIEHFEETGALYLVMEKIEGESLGSLRRRGARLSEPQIRRLLEELSGCLAYLHGHAPPIVHRDIKPGNVLLRPDGSYCLVDFGSVRDCLKPEGGSTVVGTFGYMAPEQFQGRSGPGSDVYGVAATALALLTGSEPEDLPHKGLAIDVPRALGAHFDPRLSRALAHMLEPDPDRRASSVQAALREAGLTGSGDSARRDARTAPRRTRTSAAHHETEWEREHRQAWAEWEHERWGDWSRASERGWEAEQQARRASRRARKAARRREREARRYADSLRYGRKRPPLPPAMLLGIVMLIALRVAGVATFATFRVLLPALLTLLAVFFGRELYRVAQRMSELGRAGDDGLSRAAARVRQAFLGDSEFGDDRAAEDPSAERGAGDERNGGDELGRRPRVRVGDAEPDSERDLHEAEPPRSRSAGS